jgi:hypothetical protein
MKKIIFFTMVTTLLSNAQILDAFYQLKPKNMENKECKSGKKATLCLSKSLIYPTTNVLKDELKRSLTHYIEKAKLSYKKATLNKYLDDVDLDTEDMIAGEYETQESLDLFDYNSPIMTISDSFYRYEGGAHGNGGVSFINYDIKSKKELALKDVVDESNTKFLAIAQREYRKSEKLLPNQSLQDSGWFDNKFELSDNFAITSKGLLFHYNAYDIKPYAAGMTEFLLPYSKIEPFIKSSVVKKIKREVEDKKITIDKSSNKGRATFNIQKLKDGSYKVDIDTSIYLNAKKVWFSLSFPDFKNSNEIKLLKSSNTNSFKLYKIGSKLFSKKTKKAVKSKYPLLEAESKKSDFQLSFNVKKPKEMSYFCIDYRVTTKTKSLLDNENYNELHDQQGFSVNRICLD